MSLAPSGTQSHSILSLKGQASPTVLTSCRLKENYWVLQHPKTNLKNLDLGFCQSIYLMDFQSYITVHLLSSWHFTHEPRRQNKIDTNWGLFPKDAITFVIASQPVSRELSQTLYRLYLQLLTSQKKKKKNQRSWVWLGNIFYSFCGIASTVLCYSLTLLKATLPETCHFPMWMHLSPKWIATLH